ncbi:MAG: sigma-70 family RNA polymerase sigma factor [Planctomycetota bacterium]
MTAHFPQVIVMTQHDETQFTTLIEKARDGCTDARNDLIHDCRGYLLAVARSELDDAIRPKVGVSDVVQETLLRAEKGFGDFQGHEQQELLAWLRKILKNYVIDVRRKYKASEKRDVDREVLLKIYESTRMPGMHPIDPEHTPATTASAKEELERLRTAIDSLSDEYRDVILARIWEKQSFVEIGETTGKSPDAVRMLWNRAVKRLGAAMGTR